MSSASSLLAAARGIGGVALGHRELLARHLVHAGAFFGLVGVGAGLQQLKRHVAVLDLELGLPGRQRVQHLLCLFIARRLRPEHRVLRLKPSLVVDIDFDVDVDVDDVFLTGAGGDGFQVTWSDTKRHLRRSDTKPTHKAGGKANQLFRVNGRGLGSGKRVCERVELGRRVVGSWGDCTSAIPVELST